MAMRVALNGSSKAGSRSSMTGWQEAIAAMSLFARVGLRARRKIAADEEGDLGFEAAEAPAFAGERAAAAAIQASGMGAYMGVASGVGAPIFHPPMSPNAGTMRSWMA